MKIIRAQIGAQFSSSQSEFFKNSYRIPDRMTTLGEFICFYKDNSCHKNVLTMPQKVHTSKSMHLRHMPSTVEEEEF